jgi:selenocysteine lyase/cysteine desulfurase
MNAKIRSDFPVTAERIYLDTAYDGPCPLPVTEAGKDFLERRGMGLAGRVPDWTTEGDEVKALLGRLLNAKSHEIAITTNTTEGTNIVANALDLGPDDSVVWDDLDFPSNAAVWFNQARRRGVENRIVRSVEGSIDVDDFERLMDSSTRLVTVSHVSHTNGYVHDLRALADLAHEHGAYLHVDGIQAVGGIKVDVKEAGVDFLTAGTYKWLLGPIGLAFLYVREELIPALDPVYAGWRQVKAWQDDLPIRPPGLHADARKFEGACVHFQGLYELRAALEYILGLDMDRIEGQVLRLSSRVWDGLQNLGFHLNTPSDTPSGIVTCLLRDVEKTARALKDGNVVVTFRAGNQLRVSPHFFNTEDEVDSLLEVLATVGEVS